MSGRLLATVALAAALVPAAAATAAQTRFAARASLQPTGCKPAIDGTTVRLAGCVASAPFSGTAQGTVDMSYSAKVDLAHNTGTQQGTLTFHGATAHDTLA